MGLLSKFDLVEILSTFIILFAVIDILGSIPVIIEQKERGKEVNAMKATLISAALLVGFYYAGDLLLKLFSIDIESFAVAGSIVIFCVALEMLLDVQIFKDTGPVKSATLVPIVFPLVAGAGAFTTLLSLKSQYHTENIMVALALNMVWVFFVIKSTDKIRNLFGDGGIYISRKFFGIILTAIAVKLFSANVPGLFAH